MSEEDFDALEAIAETVRKPRPDGTRRALGKYPIRVKGTIRGALVRAGKGKFKVSLPGRKLDEST